MSQKRVEYAGKVEGEKVLDAIPPSSVTCGDSFPRWHGSNFQFEPCHFAFGETTCLKGKWPL